MLRFEFAIRPAAERDLLGMRATDRRVAVMIAHWLTRVKEDDDQDLLDRLTVDGYEDEESDVRSIKALQARGINMWRVKLQDETGRWLPYRILYGFDHTRRVYHVLRIVLRQGRRGYDYSLDDPITRECLDDIEQLGIPLLR